MGDSATPHVNRWYDLINNHPGVRSAVARIPKDDVVKETQTRSDVREPAGLDRWLQTAGGAVHSNLGTVTVIHSE